MLTIHHLGVSQSERIIWLCEELGLPYELKHYTRDPVTRLAPPELRAVHPMGAAPVIEEDGIILAESGAILEYILARHGQGRLVVPPQDPVAFATYLYWLHFANGNLQPVMGRSMLLSRLDLPADNPVRLSQQGRLTKAWQAVEDRLGQSPFLGGPDLTAADIMAVFSLTTMRAFMPVDLAPYPAIRAYLQRIGTRDAYRRAMQKGDPGMAPLLT